MNNIKSKIVFFIILIAVVIFAAYRTQQANKAMEEDTSSQSISIVDIAGREVVLDHKAEKIVDLSDLLDGIRTLVFLNEQNRLIGISEKSHSVFNSDKMYSKSYIVVKQAAPELKMAETVGLVKEPNIEKIIQLNPDVIFIDWMTKDSAERIEAQTGIPVVCVGGHGSLNFKTLKIVGKIIGLESKAEELISYADSKLKLIDDVISLIPNNKRKKLFYWSHPRIGNAPKTNGNYEAFDLAGGNNLAKDGEVIPKGLFDVSKEQIIAWNPDYIFLQSTFTEKVKGWSKVEDLKQDAVIQETNAVANDCVYAIRGEFAGWDIATEIAEVYYIAKILYPDLFKDLNVQQSANEILREFYGVEGLYTDMSKSIGLYEWK
ncbi:ABC transporter substrate-binding protein [Clostridium sp. 'deep sea']|uniref:ABC transporter substrate-binding protein n=1 Tax=Clostridium sp. 'deep sea' TaxID=2779445 RepID=UPI0018969A2C|nr:ABC transporter substrate-binding protein [Clostridium sp. 'deep sea']QOR35228.1 ABC transporter substrate-binding protein [Clostridium sp. 'deep sea']